MKLAWPRDDPQTPARLGRLVRALLLILVPVVFAILVLIRRALHGERSPALATALLLIAFLAFLILQIVRMATAWRREIVAERENRAAPHGTPMAPIVDPASGTRVPSLDSTVSSPRTILRGNPMSMSETQQQPAPLEGDELVELVRNVFRPTPEDRRLAILVDLPDGRVGDEADWRQRRQLAVEWSQLLRQRGQELGLETELVLIPNAGQNNADLPARAWIQEGEDLPADVEAAESSELRTLTRDEMLGRYDLLIAPTRFSATAPLKVAARRYGFRAATMPRFSPAMTPALRLDFEEVDRRVRHLKTLLDRATGADLTFRVEGVTHRLHLDLRHRSAHASGGLIREPGQAGNLPSGETYIVPYEGEREGDRSRTRGTLPVELDGEVVLYVIEENRAVDISSEGPVSRREATAIRREPAYANLAELGLGVLADLGIEPVGEVLLDEKLGLHIAFGRSEHFGGQVGPEDFSEPAAVVHIDRVYLPATQPQVEVEAVVLQFPEGEPSTLMREGRYAIDFPR